MLLDIEHLRPHPGGIPALYPGQRNKTCLFCCVQRLAKNISGGSPLNSTKYWLLCRWPFVTLPPFLRLCSSILSHSRPTCQQIFRPERLLRRLFLAASCWSAMA